MRLVSGCSGAKAFAGDGCAGGAGQGVRAASHTRLFRATSVEEASAIGNRVFYPHHLLHLTPRTPLALKMETWQLGPLLFGEVEYGTDVRLLVDGGELLTAYHVNIPLSGWLESRYGREDVIASPHCAAVYGPVGDVQLTRWSSDCRQICLKIDRRSLETAFAELRGHETPTPLTFAPSLDLATGLGRSWLTMVRYAAAEWRRRDSLMHCSPVARSMADSILRGFLLAAGHGVEADACRYTVRHATVRLVMDIITSEAEQSLTVSELAGRAHVSVRALQSAFHREVGMSPLAYLQAVRLRRAHDDLVAADPSDTTVSEIARRWGFAHPSRFARAYKETYAVTPSDTLRH